MCHQMQAFYDTGMDKNTTEDWLKLLLMSKGEDKDIMCKLFAKSRDIKTTAKFIHLVFKTREIMLDSLASLNDMIDKIEKQEASQF